MAQVQYEGIGTLLIDSVDVDVDMNEETGISETTIGTSVLGPCLCFMIEFKYYDSSSNSTSQRCFVEHYPGQRRTAGTGWIRCISGAFHWNTPETHRKMEAVFQPELSRIFSL
jgi:hypothetical protein